MTKRGKPRRPKAARGQEDIGDQIPTRENCDLSNPDEMFLWCFTGAAGITGAPLLMTTDYYRKLSRHLYNCGARLPEAPREKWRPPTVDALSPMLAQGTWVPADEPDEEQDEVARVAAKLAPGIRQRLFTILQDEYEKEAHDG